MPKMTEKEKILAEKVLKSAPEILSEEDAMKLFEKTRVLFRNFLFNEPQPSFDQVLKKFGKMLNHVSYLSKSSLHIELSYCKKLQKKSKPRN